MRVCEGKEGQEVLLGRNVKWSGLIYIRLVVREGRGNYINEGGGRGLVIGTKAASVLGLRVIISGRDGVYIEARGARGARCIL